MDPNSYERARKRAKELRAFYAHLIVYAVVNASLIIINLITTPNTLWFYWVTVFWGIGLILHAANTLTLRSKYQGEEWEEKKAREYMEQEKREEEERKRKHG